MKNNLASLKTLLRMSTLFTLVIMPWMFNLSCSSNAKCKGFPTLDPSTLFFFQKNAIKNQRVVYYAWILLNFVVEIYGHGYIHVYMYMLHKQSGWVAFMQMDCRQIQQKATSSTSSQLVQQKFKHVYWLLFFPSTYCIFSFLFYF